MAVSSPSLKRESQLPKRAGQPLAVLGRSSPGCLREGAKSYGKGLHVERGPARGHPVQTFVQCELAARRASRADWPGPEGCGRHPRRRGGATAPAQTVASAERIAQVEQHRRLPQAVIRERTLAGLKAARARGCKGGRKFALSKAQVRLAQAAMAHRDTSVQRARYQASNALQIRRAEGGSCASRARRASPPDRSAATSAPAEHVLDLSVGFRPLPQTTRRCRRRRCSVRPSQRGPG